MKDKRWLKSVFVLTLLLFVLVLSACKKEHTHQFSTDWAKDGIHHWQACSGCDEIRNKAKHDWNSGFVTLQPTETSEGVRTFTCNSCGQTRMESVPALGGHTHTFSENWQYDDTHHWHGATCGHADEKKDYGTHQWAQGVVTVKPGVDTEGTMTFTCQDCGKGKQESIPPLGETHTHAFVEKNTSVEFLCSPATCIQKATYYLSCSCGLQGTETFEVGGFATHKFTKYVADGNATCTKDGTKTAKCDVCLVVTDVIVDIGSAKGHAFSDDWSYNETSHWHASVCGHEEEKADEGTHRLDAGVITKPATETEEGEKTYRCEICPYTKVERIGTLSHTHTFDTAYTSDDTYHWYASTCEHTDEVMGRAEHRWDAGEELSKPTVYDEGWMLYTCQDCGYKKEVSVAKIPAFTVVFLDNYNRAISHRNYALGSSSSDIVFPELTLEEGYLLQGFVSVDDGKAFSEIEFGKATENAVYQLKPIIVKTYKVTFVDYAGNPLGSPLTVVEGESIGLSLSQLPEIPAREGFTSEWDRDILTKHIIENETFSPVYTLRTFTVTFFDVEGGKVLLQKTVGYGDFVFTPDGEPYRMKEKLYGFTAWKSQTGETIDTLSGGKVENVVSDMTFYGVYETPIDAPVLAVHIDGTRVSVSLCMPDNSTLYSIRFSIGWMEKEGIVNLESATVAQTSSLDTGDCEHKKEEWMTYNNKTKTVDFVFGCGNGHAFRIITNLLTLNFGANDTAQVTEEIFTLLENSAVVYENGTGAKEAPLRIWFY